MNEERIKEVLSDEEFVRSLMELDTPEEVQKALAEKDVDLSINEIKKIAELMKKKVNGELNDEELEAVAGGSIGVAILTTYLVAHAVALGAIAVHVETRRRW